MAMIDKLNVIFQRYNEVNDLIIQPDVISDSKRYVQLNREYKNLKPLVEVRLQYLELSSRIEEAKGVLKEEKDADFREMAKMELDELEPTFEALEEEVKLLLLPKIRRMIKMLWLRFVKAPGAMKEPFSQAIYLECTSVIVRVEVGR